MSALFSSSLWKRKPPESGRHFWTRPALATPHYGKPAAKVISQGLYADAEPIMQECLRLNLEALSPRHPETLTPRSNLAIAYWYLGKFADAEKMTGETVDVSREVTGPKSFQTLYY